METGMEMGGYGNGYGNQGNRVDNGPQKKGMEPGIFPYPKTQWPTPSLPAVWNHPLFYGHTQIENNQGGFAPPDPPYNGGG